METMEVDDFTSCETCIFLRDDFRCAIGDLSIGEIEASFVFCRKYEKRR